MALLDALSERYHRLAAASSAERQRLYESTGGNPLLLRWTVAQLGRTGSQCHTIDEACEFLEKAPPNNDPLEYVFGDLLDTFTESEIAVLAALAHFSLPAEVRWIADISGLPARKVRTALEDLADRALLVGDAGAETFVLPRLAANYLRRSCPENIAQTGNRLTERTLTLVLENGFEEYERFPALENAWPMIAAALPLLLLEDNAIVQTMSDALEDFLDFSGRWDDGLRLSLQAEASASSSGDLYDAGWRACRAGYMHHLRGEALEVFACADRAATHWRHSDVGTQERAVITRLRGLGHRLNKDYPSAIEAFSKSVALYRSFDNEGLNVAISLNDLAGAKRATRDFIAAERDYKDALEIATKAGDREEIAYITGNLALLTLDRQDWPTAEILAREALGMAESIGRQELIGSNCDRLARALARQGRSNEGLPYAQRAVEIFMKLNKTSGLKAAQRTLRECTQAGYA